MSRAPLVVTHNNHFHADDVIACFMLKTIHPRAQIVRTRDRAEIERGDFVVDVGGEYCPERRRYDHHQRGFSETYSEHHRIKLSSAGLVYKHHGEEFLQALGLSLREHREAVVRQIYEEYFQCVDANDNGIDIADSVRYRERTLDDIVRSMNPLEFPGSASYLEQEETRLECFGAAMRVLGEDLVRLCRKVHIDVARAASVLEQAYQDAQHPSHLVLGRPCFFESVIPYYNEKYGKNVLAVIYPRATDAGTVYSIRCLNRPNARYQPEAPLCERWRGLREDVISKEPGMESALFVHATGFCGAAKTLACAEHMVQESLKEHAAHARAPEREK